MFKKICKSLIGASAFALTIGATTVSAADVYIDVRTPQEYAEDHIDGHYNIVHTDILEGVKRNIITPDDNIYVYCRSGKRASIAKDTLNNAGYDHVTNLGGINDARKTLGIK